MKRVLITGVSSYIGSSIRSWLLRSPERYRVDMVSLRDDGWQAMSFSGYDAVIHCAAIVHREDSKNDPDQAELYDRVNARLPVAVAQKAKAEGVGQFLFLSTASVYGLTAPFGEVVTITADTPLAPADNYGISKAKAEAALSPLADDSFAVAIIRPPMVYGRGCRGNYNTLAKLAKKLPVFPYVPNSRSMLYIDNLSELVRLLIDNGDGGVFCPQNGEYVNTCDMVRQIAEVNSHKIRMIPGFGWALKLLRRVTPAVDKAFGSLRYAPEISNYRENYCVKDFCVSITETEC